LAVLNKTRARWHAFCLPRLCVSVDPVYRQSARVVRPVLVINSFTVSGDGSSVHVTLRDVMETLRTAVGRLVAGRGDCLFWMHTCVWRCVVSHLSWWGMLKNRTRGLWFCVNQKNCSQSGINVLMEQENLGKTLRRLFMNGLQTLQRVATRRALLCSVACL